MRQVSLLKGRPLPAESEFSLHCALADLLRRWCNPEFEWTHIPLGEKRDEVTGARLKRMGVNPGWPDFIFIGQERVAFLELKRQGGKLTERQQLIAEHVEGNGCDYLCTDSFNEAVEWLRRQNIVRAKVSA